MFFVQSFRPDPQLREFVDNYLFISSTFSEPYVEYNVLPHVFLCMSFNLGPANDVYDLANNEYISPHIIVGPTDKICRFRFFKGMKRIIVNLKFSGWYKLFRTPVGEFVNHNVSLEGLLGEEMQAMNQRLREGADNRSHKELLDEFLLHQLESQKKNIRQDIDEALRLILESKGKSPIKIVATNAFITRRTMERHFLQQTGFYPKMFSRIVRFNETIKYIRKRPGINWSRQVHALGYYDQSHFINEFQFFAGCAPHQFFKQEPESEMVTFA